MKFNVPEDQIDEFTNHLMSGNKDVLQSIIFWCLQRFEHLQKRAYLSKYLTPAQIPGDFMGDDLIIELSQHLKSLQNEFKEVHKTIDQLRSEGARPGELKAEIAQLESERTQLQSKIAKLKKDSQTEDPYFHSILKATSLLRKEQEEEVRLHERLRENRKHLVDVEQRLSETNRRLNEMKNSGIQNQSADKLFANLQSDVRQMSDKRDSLENEFHDRENHLSKLQGWDKSDRMTTEDDVRAKRMQLQDMEEQVAVLQERLDAALERNAKLVVFRQASSMAMAKLREKEEDISKLLEEKSNLTRKLDDKENELRAQGKSSAKMGKMDLKKYGAEVKLKIDKYKKMREQLSQVRAELVVLQRTEQILKSRHKNIDEFLAEMEKRKGVSGYRDTQKALVEMTEKAAEVDLMKGATLEQISSMVEQINREFRSKQVQLKPLIDELKQVRQEYLDFESEYMERKGSYDKVAIGLELEKQGMEQECDNFQEECLREESRFHYLNSLIALAKIKLERADQEKKWQNGDGRLMRDFATLKDLYANKLTQQDQLTKALRKKQKELKENSGVMTNQKTNFINLQLLLNAKVASQSGSNDGNIKVRGKAVGDADVFTLPEQDDYY